MCYHPTTFKCVYWYQWEASLKIEFLRASYQIICKWYSALLFKQLLGVCWVLEAVKYTTPH